MFYYDGTDAEVMATADHAKGEMFREKADEWIAKNGECWEFMTRAACASAARGKRFGMKSLVEAARWNMLVNGVDEFAINNSYVSAFARRLIEEHPECKPYISTRSSVVDL